MQYNPKTGRSLRTTVGARYMPGRYRTLTAASAAEQASAGLDRLDEDEFHRFHALNHAYRQRFGFPFVICVRLQDKAGILAELQRRLDAPRNDEIATALAEIGKIVHLRLEALP